MIGRFSDPASCGAWLHPLPTPSSRLVRHRRHQLSRYVAPLSAGAGGALTQDTDPLELTQEAQGGRAADVESVLDESRRHKRVLTDDVDQGQAVGRSQR